MCLLPWHRFYKYNLVRWGENMAQQIQVIPLYRTVPPCHFDNHNDSLWVCLTTQLNCLLPVVWWGRGGGWGGRCIAAIFTNQWCFLCNSGHKSMCEPPSMNVGVTAKQEAGMAQGDRLLEPSLLWPNHNVAPGNRMLPWSCANLLLRARPRTIRRPGVRDMSLLLLFVQSHFHAFFLLSLSFPFNPSILSSWEFL